MNEQTDLLREIRDLLRIIAEPELAKRDEKLRNALSEVVGRSRSQAKAILLMDGSRSQKAICKEAQIDPGQLSRLTKALRSKSLLAADDKQPKLTLAVPPNFFDSQDNFNG